MGILRGIETLGIGKAECKELFYAGAGTYEDTDGEQIKVLDIICLECRKGGCSGSQH